MHVIVKVFEVLINEYRIKNNCNKDESIVCSLLSLKQIFINLKFEIGIFQNEIPLNNSINIKCEINKMKMEISTKCIINLLKLIVKR